ncbi:putative ribonuclease H-like domain-containing protein [Tanacetum coccineum]|uniref:Ribonuclease H-like domain-containing protein n=1 Tax=Tanacetum coccineum TaxID=301880 RepID=A0ABQ5IM56_9ASTR
MVPRAVLMKTGLKTINNARPVNTVRHMSGNTSPFLYVFYDFCGRFCYLLVGGAIKAVVLGKDETTEILKNFIKEIENLVDKKVKIIRSDNETEFKNKVLDEFCKEKADSKLLQHILGEAVSTTCYVQNRVLIVKPHNKTPYELFRVAKLLGYTTLEQKSSGKLACWVSLENKPMLEGNGPKWLFDLDSLTQSMNYVPVVAGTFSNDFAGIQGVSESSTSSQQDQDNQDCIVMPIWKDASYFDDASPRSVADAQLQDQNGTHDDCSLQNNGTADQQVNTASPEVNTGSRVVSTAVPEVNTATPEDLMGPIPTSEDTQVEDQEIELGNISPSYAVSSTPHTRIHKDHPIDHVIGDVQSSVQTRRMITSYSELGFLGAIYEGKTHQDLHTCLFACFLSQEEPKRVSKALSDLRWSRQQCSRWTLLQFKLQMSQRRKKGIFISQDKYVHEFLRKFNFSDVKSASTPTDLEKPLVKDGDADDVDEHLYRSMIGSLMYLTASRPDIMFQMSCLGFTDSDYAGATLDRKSTTGGCQFLGNRLISWQCKKQTVVATSTTEAEYVAAASCHGQKKSTGSAGFHQIIDFLNRSHICYALTKKPEVCVSFIKQFWRSAEASTDDNGEVKINATIDGHSLSITEGSLRRHLKLADQDGITSIPNSEIFEQLALMGYHTDSDKIDVLEDDLRKTKTTYSSAITKLILRVKKLEARVKIGKARRQTRVVLSDDEDIADDSSKQGRKLSDVEIKEGSEKSKWRKVSTAGAKKEKRSRQDKGKAIMIESEPKKKSKKELEQERLSYAEAIRLEEQMDEEQRAQIARDEEISRQNYKISDFKGMSYNDIRLIFENIWDFNQNIEPMDAEHESGKQKSPEKSPKKSPEKMKSAEKMEEDDVAKETRAKRKKFIPRKSTRKRQKMEKDSEKEELKGFLDIIPREEVHIEVESISTKFPIVDWKTYVLTETFMYYHVSERLEEKELILLMVKAADLEISVMELENSQNNALAKLPMLKLGEYEMWEIRIKQYFQIQDYALCREFREAEKKRRQKEEEANIALIESLENTQAMMDADFQLAQQMQTEKQEHLSIEEKSKLFVELLEKRKKHFAALRAKEKRNKPPTKTQKRMYTYLKNMVGYKHNQLNRKSYDEIQEMFDKEMKRENTFVDIDTELVKDCKTKAEESSKRAREELESDNSKKQKIDEHVEAEGDDDQEETEMKKHMDIVQHNEVSIDAIPLATKPLVIVEWKIVKEGKMGYI